MDSITVLDADAVLVGGRIDGGRAFISASSLPEALGWTLKPEGLCRGDVCVPVRDRDGLRPEGSTVDGAPGDGDADLLDLEAVASALDRPSLVDAEASVVVIGAPTNERQAALSGGMAPNFSLPDLDGTQHDLADWEGTKRLIVVFSSW